MDLFSGAALAVIAASLLYTVARKGLLALGIALALLIVFLLQVVASLARVGVPIVILSPVTFDLALFIVPGGMSAPWTWATFQFVHGSEVHLLLNLLGLVFIAPVFEERVGSPAWAVLFFLGGAFGALVFALLHPDGVALIGASAGILAVFGGYGRLYPRERIRLFLPLPGIPALPAIHVVLGFLVLELFLSLGGPSGIAWEAHVAGMAFGLAVAPAASRIPARRRRPTKLASLAGLRPLATTRELASILAEAEAADIPEVRDAWIEKFVRGAQCPRCGGPLRVSLGRLTSDCGWKGKLKE